LVPYALSRRAALAKNLDEMRTPLARIRFALAVIGNRGDGKLNEKLAARSFPFS